MSTIRVTEIPHGWLNAGKTRDKIHESTTQTQRQAFTDREGVRNVVKYCHHRGVATTPPDQGAMT